MSPDPRWAQLPDSYNKVAEHYLTEFGNELDRKPYDRDILTDFASGADDPVVELGSGPGHVGAFVRDQGPRVVGLDLSYEMTRLATRQLDSAVNGDLRALPLADASIGGIVAFYSLIHLGRDQLVGALAECRRVLRPGGELLYAIHEGEGEIAVDDFLGEAVPFIATLFTRDELIAATGAAGLDVVLAEQRGPYEFEHPHDRVYVRALRPL